MEVSITSWLLGFGHRQCTNKHMIQVHMKLGIKLMGYEKIESDRIYLHRLGRKGGMERM